jgi:GNAT superfamily N-acetyltransferase
MNGSLIEKKITLDTRLSKTVKIVKLDDASKIASIINQDYSDPPVCFFSPNVINILSSRFFIDNPDVFFLVAEVDDIYAGFVFGHCLGPRFWRIFATKNPKCFLNVAYIILLQRFKRSKFMKKNTRGDGLDLNKQNSLISLPSSEGDFPWKTTWGNGGILEFIVVRPEFRGMNIAPQLISALDHSIRAKGILYTEAHISRFNNSSIQAFIKAGFSATRVASGDVWVSKPNQVEEGI